MKIQLCQTNPTVGDLKGNMNIIQQGTNVAVQNGCDVIVFPELMTVGYPPRDLLYDKSIWDNHNVLVEKMKQFINGLDYQITVIFGGLYEMQLSYGRFARYNAAYVIDPVEGIRLVLKRLLPCYDVFDETRYFVAAVLNQEQAYFPVPIWVNGKNGLYSVNCDVLICEDIWNFGCRSRVSWMSPASYAVDPIDHLKGDGPLFVINGSPWWEGKIQTTIDLLSDICEKIHRPICWVNQIGAHDDIITGGYSMCFIPSTNSWVAGERAGLPHFQMAKPFAEDAIVVDLSDQQSNHHRVILPATQVANAFPGLKMPSYHGQQIDPSDYDLWCLISALKLHLLDYFRRTGHKTAVLGLSGGIDSAVVGAIAAEALGGQNVTGITMPAPFSSSGSWEDAEALALSCKMDFLNWDITDAYKACRAKMLSGGKQTFDHSVTDENIMPRIRGLLLMMYSNDHPGCLLLSTGNKSEMAVGYCTLYGDMCGGLAMLSDVLKTDVFRLAGFMNKYNPGIIPINTINKPPSAELAPDQKDTDSLPDYADLDPMLMDLIEHQMPTSAVKLRTKLPEWVDKIAAKIRATEHKRTQTPIGAKTRERSFGSGRRIPVAKNVRLV